MTNVVQLHALEWEHLKGGNPVRVARLDCETFEVQVRLQPMKDTRRSKNAYIVRNRTHFVGGQRVCRTLDRSARSDREGMMGLFAQRDEITELKTKARKALERFRAIGQHYDCGASMLRTVSSKAAQAADEYNAAMERLAVIDPACPKWERL